MDEVTDRYGTAVKVWVELRELVLERADRRREVAEATGMSFVRSKALLKLAKAPLKMSELTGLLAVDKPYTTLVVDDLEKRGLVVRSVHPDDRRCKIVTITDRGREVADRAQAILAQPPEGLLGLEERELDALASIVRKLY
jgi:DNA-binding MarR family transcriptional regulator